ncbi:MAG: ParB/RepB/Spo0J family partition protein [Lachnospiraceae bacterium]|nr:ParB/RepB/Spo0J family partition protein [Lachnospiraceae bacterium]
MAVKREKIHFESVEELLGAPVTKDGTEEIRIDQIFPFENHPFKVLDDDRMQELVESIKSNGVLSPVIVRPDDEGTYEMISGHRRMHAAKLAGLTTVPAIVKQLTNDEAVILMVDANIQREEILPSERAFSLKMKMDAMNRQGARTDLTLGRDVPKWSHEEIGKENGISGRQVKRYIRLTELIPEMLDMVDDKRLGLMLAVDISFFDKDLQKWLYEYIRENGFLKSDQIAALKNTPNLENVTQYTMIQILNSALPEVKVSGKVTLSEKKLDKYFPPHFSAVQREKVIIGLLEEWQSRKDGE